VPFLLHPFSGSATRRARPSRLVGLLVAGALVLAVLISAVGRPAGPAALAVPVVALAGAAGLALRARWVALAPVAARRVASRREAPLDGEALTERLRLLHEASVEKVNLAVQADRLDLVDELSDSYADEALRLLSR
jgi:hypothetical protein